ncbi:hypothetical protein DL95DRAFT_472218 [Leptodontidium sp. 2 PMI_412]|nr:hypothetical protein DL95DRAFT_472218 [Leptodontidium sp. 2 PMI_412]
MAHQGTSDDPNSIYPSASEMFASAQPYPPFPNHAFQDLGARLVYLPRAEIPSLSSPQPKLLNGAALLAALRPVDSSGHVTVTGYDVWPPNSGQSLAAAQATPIWGLVLYLPNGQRASADTHRVMAFHNKEMTARAKIYSEMPILPVRKIRGSRKLPGGKMAFCVGYEKFGEARCDKRGVDQKGAFPICVDTPDGVGCAACHWDSQGRQCKLYVGVAFKFENAYGFSWVEGVWLIT